jgi:exonuclease SbcC
MWRLKEIYAENICSFRELRYMLHQGVTTLVFGDNRDNESQQSNGSGKSALIECIALGISGSALRKIKNEEIINDNADACLVRLLFENESCREAFTVERQIFRKGASSILCTIERDGKTIDTDEAVQVSVEGYNRYILEKLGITRDELFNHFILSKFKYQDFLSSPDKEKKEIINRFSNGNLVERAIEKIMEDKQPVEARYKELELELAGVDGRIDMLAEQIEREENKREERRRTKAEKVADMENRIAGKRTLIRTKKEEIAVLKADDGKLEAAGHAVGELEKGNLSLECVRKEMEQMLIPLVCGKLTDWDGVISGKKEQVSDAEAKLKRYDDRVAASEKILEETIASCSLVQKEYRIFCLDYDKKETALNAGLEALKIHLDLVIRETDSLRRRKRELSGAIDRLNNSLAGIIACPSCGHEFSVADKGFDVLRARTELTQKKEEWHTVGTDMAERDNKADTIELDRGKITAERKSLASLKLEWADKLSAGERRLKGISLEGKEIKENRHHVSGAIARLQNEINAIRRDMFDEAFGLIDDSCRTNKRKADALEEDIRAAESAIDTLENTIKELDNNAGSDIVTTLKASLKEYRKKSADVLAGKVASEKEKQLLEEQEQYFIQFKTYLANTKIEALSKITNEFLEEIGSDIRIRFSGYTSLKTGKIREKISVSLIRSGVDCGSFGKLSAGEAARVNLATILSMQKLVNATCETSRGLDLLVLDEILEAVDEEGLSHTFEALNRIGVTALVVSHGHIAEGYEHKLNIIKENGESKIEQ